MEIHALKLTITEQDLNSLLKKHLRDDQPLEDVEVRVTPQGITFKGMYPLFINVSFETQWELAFDKGKLSARLTNFRAMGVPGNVFKSAILKFVSDAAKAEPWIQVERETVWIDVDRALLKNGLAA